MSRIPDAFKCKFCGAVYDNDGFLGKCRRDDDGNFEFRCRCGCTEYTELMECKLCHGLYDINTNKRLRWWHVCNDCCGAVINEFNSALDGIADDYREILKQIYDIEPIKEV